MHPGRRVVIPKEVLRDIVEHAREEAPREACGLLLGSSEGSDVVIKVNYRAENVSESEFLYEVSPYDIYRALKEAESSGMELVGVYHSHPLGEPIPSPIDVERAVPGLVYLIVSRGDLRAFELVEGELREVEVSIDGGDPPASINPSAPRT